MKILCWNCRGLGNPRTVQDLSLMVKEKQPILVFVCETKIRSCKIVGLQRRLGMEGSFAVDSEGRRGGIVQFWRDEKGAEIVNYSKWHVTVIVKGERQEKDWCFTGFYGHPESGKRRLSWDLLRQLKPTNDGAWCVGGDFYEILWHNEKVGGKRRAETQINLFREAIEDCGLVDVGYRGNGFTWSNKHSHQSFTKERLDRFVVNNEWKSIFKEVEVMAQTGRCSDHLPIVISTIDEGNGRRRGFFQFRFEACWLQQEECEHVVKEGWRKSLLASEPIQQVQTRL
ncbi:uncharacterized protein LOC122310274 [Carya illinoinensis]|uniref:uncharacterized protein LOC122310274 n=1 Tax=Carya illinoinensis TaxID=32201 RepID=UPI001C724385|nr:uncharacterized protein LOC122310274 [Carya illinoinensis]